MWKLIKYIKPFALSLFVVIALLFAQAQCELALPDAMSKIVDVGISKHGIEDGVFEVVRESKWNQLQLFINDEDYEIVQSSYQKITSKDASKEQKEKYPYLKKEALYLLKDIEKAQREQLNQILSKSQLYVVGFSQQLNDSKSDLYHILMDENNPMVAYWHQQGINDPFKILAQLPKEQLTSMQKKMDAEIDKMGEQVYETSGSILVKNEYEQIGLNIDHIQNRYILKAGAWMLLLSLLSATCAILVGLFASRIGAGFARNLRKDVFEKVEQFSSEELNHFAISSLITRTTNDVQRIQMVLIMFLRVVIYAPIIGLGAISHVLSSGASMTWIIALCVVVLLSLISVLMWFTMPKFKLSQTYVDRLNSVTKSHLEGMSVIRAFNTQRYEEEKFSTVNKQIMKNQLFINRSMSFMMPAMMFVMNATSLLILWIGSHLIESGDLQVGAMMAFMQYAMQIIMAFLMIAMVAVILPNAIVSANRILAVLQMKVKIKEEEQTLAFDEKKRGEVEFRNVCFHYPNAEEDVLHDISFVAKNNQVTAFIGSTGSGKSTIVNLVPRFYDVSKGQILVDGVDVRKVSLRQLRDKIGYVPQKGVLFRGSIESNLRYGNNNASIEELNEAVNIAQAKEVIDDKEGGYASLIAQGGSNVSGGQRQRLSIARALVKDAEIYIFDDSFSALDYKTDARLRKELNEMIKRKHATVLLVAQRISSIRHADQIVVLDQGKIVGIGKHEELLKTCNVYQEIAYSQLSKEELGNE